MKLEKKTKHFLLINFFRKITKYPLESCLDKDDEVTGSIEVRPKIFNNETIVELKINVQLADHEKCKDDPTIRGGITSGLMAVLGIMHTHQRHDRDDFIIYNEDCVIEDSFGLGLGPLAQFTKLTKDEAPTFGIPYKCNSIMHFTSEQLGKPNCKVLE